MGPSVCADGLGCVDGTCGPLPVEGEACTFDHRCADGLACEFGGDGETCIVPKTAGQACANEAACGAGLHCDFATSACAADLALGAPCTDSNECGPKGACMPGSGGAKQCTTRPSAGERCASDCASGLACVVVPEEAGCVPEVCLEL
jgi:hypothetical protein